MTAKRGDAVFDLDAASAARREAAGEGFKFTWHGEEFSCLSAKEWPITVMADMSKGDLVAGLYGILGDEQGEKFLAGNPTNGDLEDLMTAVAQFSGVNTLGE
jgi:hypothetical protein